MTRTKYDRVAEYLSISVIALSILSLLLMVGELEISWPFSYFVVLPLTVLLIAIGFLREMELRRE